MPLPENLDAMLARIRTAPPWGAENLRAEVREYIVAHPEDEFLVRWAMGDYAQRVWVGKESRLPD